MTQRDFTEMVQDWWGFAAFIAGTVLSFWMGTKRREWELRQAVKDIEDLKQRVRETEKATNQEAASIQKMEESMSALAKTQERILNSIERLQTGKVDK